jgi:DNA-binding SARP family transcriptional activator
VPAFKVCLFGRFCALQNGQELDCFPSAKAKELFCYLLLHRDRAHPRETLATLLWSECTAVQTKKHMRQTLWQLQHALHQLAPGGGVELLRTDNESVRLDSSAEMWLDVGEFEQAFAPAQGIKGDQLDEARAEALRKAVALYEGNLLEGWYQDWCLYHRERLENNYLSMLDKLMVYCEAHQDYESGFSHGERSLRQDRARESTYYRLMRLHYFAGDRAGALRQFQRCQAALKEELAVEPAKRTVELRRQICADQVAGGSAPAANIPPKEFEPDLSDHAAPFLRGLRKLRSVLMKIQRRVERDIREVDRILGAHTDV